MMPAKQKKRRLFRAKPYTPRFHQRLFTTITVPALPIPEKPPYI